MKHKDWDNSADKNLARYDDSSDNVMIIKEEIVYEGFFKFVRCHFRHRRFDQSFQEVTREIHVRPDAVAVLLYDPSQDAIILVEQIRAGILLHNELTHSHKVPWLLEPVAGLIDEAQTPIEVAYREVAEETGYEIQKLHPIFSYFASPGASTERVHLFYALVDSTQFSGVHGLASEQEDIRVHVIEYEDARRLMQENQLDNAMTILLLQWLASERASLRATQ